MALQTFNNLMVPNPAVAISPFTSITLNSAGYKAAFIVQVPKSGNISKIGFRVYTLTTSKTLRVGLETVNTATGVPTGNQYGGSAVGIQAAPAQNTYYTVTLGTPATAVAGDVVAIVIQFDSDVGNLLITCINNLSVFPYCAKYTASWAKQTILPVGHLEYDDSSVGDAFILPQNTSLLENFKINSDPDERGLKFKLPFPCRLKGIWRAPYTYPAGDFDIVVYDSDGSTVLETLCVIANESNVYQDVVNYFLFADPVTLLADTWYRVVLKPSSTNICYVSGFTVTSAYLLDSVSAGQNFHYTSRVDAGAWTDNTLKRLFLGLILDQFDDGAGGGGGGGGGFASVA